MSGKTRGKVFGTRQIATTGILAAVATVLFAFVPSIPVVPNIYNLDFSNIPVMLGGFAMGPIPGLVILLIKDVVHFLIRGLSETVGVGDIADFITCASFMLPAAIMYQRKRTLNTAMTGMVVGMVLVTVISVFLNKWFLFPTFSRLIPYMTLEKIVETIGKVFPFADTEWKAVLLVTAPFNLIKSIMIMVVTFFIYKPLSPILKGNWGRR